MFLSSTQGAVFLSRKNQRPFSTSFAFGNSFHSLPSSNRPAFFFPTFSMRKFLSMASSSPNGVYDSGGKTGVLPCHPNFSGMYCPHCLKKKGTPAALHWSRKFRAQSGCIGLALCPLSPPQITH